MQSSSFATIISGLTVAEEGDLTISVRDNDGNELARTNPMRITGAETPDVHFWADIHGQSNETLGTGSAREYFEFGRGQGLR